MSKQLAVTSAFSVFALSALALFAPVQSGPAADVQTKGAMIEITAPQLFAGLR